MKIKNVLAKFSALIKKILNEILFYLFMPFYLIYDRANVIWHIIKANPKKAFWIGLPVFMYEACVIWLVWQYFYDPKKDTFSLTSIGFAMCISVSSVCFSWLKTLDSEKEKHYIDRIKKCGEISFGIGILFVLATALKYGVITYNAKDYKGWYFHMISILMGISSVFSFMLAFFKSGKIIKEILSIIYDRNDFTPWDIIK